MECIFTVSQIDRLAKSLPIEHRELRMVLVHWRTLNIRCKLLREIKKQKPDYKNFLVNLKKTFVRFSLSYGMTKLQLKNLIETPVMGVI
jgi:hypothetical protein